MKRHLTASTRRRGGLILILVGVLAGVLAATASALSSGTYSGTTSQHDPVSVTVSGGAISQFNITWNADCGTGQLSGLTTFQRNVPISKNRWGASGTYTAQSGNGYTEEFSIDNTGTVSRANTLAGTFTGTVKVIKNSTHRQVDTCRSGTVTFTLAPNLQQGTFKGRTAQNEPYTVVVSGGRVTSVKVAVDDICANGAVVHFEDSDGPLTITGNTFFDTFSRKNYAVTLSGHFTHGGVIGRIVDTVQKGGRTGRCVGSVNFGQGDRIEAPFNVTARMGPVPGHPTVAVLSTVFVAGDASRASLVLAQTRPPSKHVTALRPRLTRTRTRLTGVFAPALRLAAGAWLIVGLDHAGAVERVKAYALHASATHPGLVLKWERCAPMPEPVAQLLGFAREPAVTVPCH